jgi:hypothetical protein
MLIRLLVTCAVILSPGFAMPPVALSTPPTIDELDGATFTLVAKGPQYDLVGEKSTSLTTIETTITKTGPTTVSFSGVFGGMGFTANYVDGFLLQAVNSGENPAESGSLTQARVTGKPGKFRIKGTLTVYDGPPDFQVLRVLKLKGKQVP